MRDLTGEVFGRLTAIRLTGRRDKSRSLYWLCRCECGNEKEISSRQLTSRKTLSCGCYHKEIITNDLVGIRFGRLLVVERLERKATNGSFFWKCLCDCGNYTEITTGNLRANITRSCGCLAVDTARNLMTIHGLSGTKEGVLTYSRNRKERKKSLDNKWNPDMEKSIRLYFPLCVLCYSSSNLQVDHLRPISKGFGLRLGNAVILCRKCNLSKGNKNLIQFSLHRQKILVLSALLFKEYYEGIHLA